MVQLIAIPALIAGLAALWVVGRTDFLRLVQGVWHTRGTVVRHIDSLEGFVAVYEFEHAGRQVEVRSRLAHALPSPPVGTTSALSYPRRRPDLARPPEVFARTIMYAGFVAWFVFFSNLAFGWP